MRIWDVALSKLCGRHLLGQHREIHAIWNILTKKKKGYRNHPEVLRWKTNLRGLLDRHDRTAREMKRRGFRHASPVDTRGVRLTNTPGRWESRSVQIRKLRAKKCPCRI